MASISRSRFDPETSPAESGDFQTAYQAGDDRKALEILKRDLAQAAEARANLREFMNAGARLVSRIERRIRRESRRAKAKC